MIPLVGAVLPLVLIPGVAVGFMAACRNTIAGKPVFPTVLVDGFRSYGATAAMRLLELGGLYVAAMALVFASSALADGGALFKLMMGTEAVAPETLAATPLLKAGLVAFVCYLPVAMLFLVRADAGGVARRAARQGDVLQPRDLLAQSRRVHRLRRAVARHGDRRLARRYRR